MQFNSMKVAGDGRSQAIAENRFETAKRVVLRASIGLVVLTLGFPASASGPAVSFVADQDKPSDMHPVKAFRRWIETGKASWYGFNFQGRRTANGESFDMNQMTCAHRSLPLGSWVKVTNLKNRKAVVVRVNDRGPALDDRIVDLSYAAAQAVGLRGIGKVRLDRMREDDPDLTRALLARVQMPLIPSLALR
jgi:rare lipoprotein A